MEAYTGFTPIKRVANIANDTHGGRAKCLQRLIRLDLPVPKTVALSFETVKAIAVGDMPNIGAMLRSFGENPMVSVRPSSEDPDWGGPGALLNIGMNDARHEVLVETLGEEAANALYLRFVQSFAVNVARLDPDMFEFDNGLGRDALRSALDAYAEETEEPFPQDPEMQLAAVLRSMARAWEGTSARLLRQARGAPANASLGLVVQQMVLGVGPGESGAGVIQFIDPATGEFQITGRFLGQSQGRDALRRSDGAMFLTKDERGISLEVKCPELFKTLKEFGDLCRTKLREEMQIEFTVEKGVLHVLDAVRVQRSPHATVKVAVDLVTSGIITKKDALLRVDPHSVPQLLHQQVDPTHDLPEILQGIGASPGAAIGRIVFTSTDAQASEARGEQAILVRRETSPEDIRGMHAAAGVLTERGGMTSHAAVIARGLGKPCIVGANEITIDLKKNTLIIKDGPTLEEGDMITLNGTAGAVLAGAAPMLDPGQGDAFRTMLNWANDACDIKVRANADTPEEAKVARSFDAEGIGLCRTEHMFFEENRLSVMREVIFTDDAEDRAAALARLLPMQRQDFRELFSIMQGLPVCIRLLDPPLHEFLPTGQKGLRNLAETMGLALSDVTRRVATLREFNPMLGMRGVRLGVTVPEIYDMQARAIFEATIESGEDGTPVVPEIMVPLVSARKEVELVKSRIDAVAAEVKNRTGSDFDFRLGVMVETPRAALVADQIAQHAAFLSFGTNDLTQMAYGLSRDDAGRFMGEYVSRGVYQEDPFHILDVEGVGELLNIGAERARSVDSEIVLAMCGEHGGNPESIEFCRRAGFDYVSCSPYRVPVARMAAAHLALKQDVSD